MEKPQSLFRDGSSQRLVSGCFELNANWTLPAPFPEVQDACNRLGVGMTLFAINAKADLAKVETTMRDDQTITMTRRLILRVMRAEQFSGYKE